MMCEELRYQAYSGVFRVVPTSLTSCTTQQVPKFPWPNRLMGWYCPRNAFGKSGFSIA